MKDLLNKEINKSFSAFDSALDQLIPIIEKTYRFGILNFGHCDLFVICYL